MLGDGEGDVDARERLGTAHVVHARVRGRATIDGPRNHCDNVIHLRAQTSQ